MVFDGIEGKKMTWVAGIISRQGALYGKNALKTKLTTMSSNFSLYELTEILSYMAT